MNPSVTLLYVHVANDAAYQQMAIHFATSYLGHPPDCPHRTMIVSNHTAPDVKLKTFFDRMPDVEYITHNNTGWDIGAYIEGAKRAITDIIVCCGSHCFFTKSGWLKRMVEAWVKHGPGMYGTFASYQIRPHLNTFSFWCAPDLLPRYPLKVSTKAERYDFEHGPNNFWQCVHADGLPVKLVTWNGEYDWRDWRKPSNIFFRGNQSNCLLGSRLTRAYDQASPGNKRILAYHADKLTIPHFTPPTN